MKPFPPKIKELNTSKSILVVGMPHLGLNSDILKALEVFRASHKMHVYSLGGVVSEVAKRMYDSRFNDRREFEKMALEQEQLKESGLDTDTDDIQNYNRAIEKLQSLYNKNSSKLDQMEEEIEAMEAVERHIIQVVKQNFNNNCTFVANCEQILNTDNYGENLIEDNVILSKHLRLESVQTNGSKTTSQPITDRVFAYNKNFNCSVITPHPTPALRSFHREGLNKAYNFYTTGCLYYPTSANRPSEYFKAVHEPSALAVFLDEKSGEFHVSRLRFNKLRCPFAHRIKDVILVDGLAYSGSGIWEVGSAETAVYSTDDHAPYEHRGVLSATRALVELTKAETFINGGDACDWISVCPHNAGSPLYAENLRFSDDEAAFKRLMAAQTDNPCIKRKVFIDANHEDWINRMVSKNPFLVGLMDQESVYKRAIPDWEYHLVKGGEDFTYYFGDLAIRHGHNIPSLSYAYKLFKKYLGGHVHAHDAFMGVETAGAGCGLGPKYLANGITKWQNTVTTITRYQGKTEKDVKSVLHDDARKVSRFCYRGRIYEVPWHVYPGEKK